MAGHNLALKPAFRGLPREGRHSPRGSRLAFRYALIVRYQT